MKNKLLLLAITLLALFFYTYHLKETQLFINDTSRDTLQSLRIWQEKKVTLIGAPLSLTQNTIREVYFGSLYLYLAIAGLVLADWDIVGAIYPNVLFFTLSVVVFYYLTANWSKSASKRLVATLIYAISPVTVTHARFFWNPNLIIPFSVFCWFFLLKPTQSRREIFLYSFIAGLLAGIIFNFHYLAIVPVLVFLTMARRDNIRFISCLAGLILGISPIIFFEFKHQFYLTGAMVYNLSHAASSGGLVFLSYPGYFLNIIWSFWGLKPAEISYPVIYKIQVVYLYLISLITVVFLILRKGRQGVADLNIDRKLWIPVIVSVLLTVYFSKDGILQLRYLFSVYPLVIWILFSVLWSIKPRLLIMFFLLPMISASWLILYNYPNLQESFLPVATIEKISAAIVADQPAGTYNLTENLHGDARATVFRYFITRDALVKPQDELTYNNLSTIYVISPTLEKVYKEGRWEFTASSPWKMVFEKDFGEVNLYKFEKALNE